MTQSFSSGSTIFGDTIDDTHKFTGSLSVTGSSTFAGRILGHEGTAALPTYAFSGDPNTGMFQGGASDNLQFSTGGVVRAFLSATQWNVTGNIVASGALSGTTLNTGQGANELYAMDQNVRTTDTVTFDSTSDTSSDARYADDRDKVTLQTDTSTKKMILKNNIPKTFSMSSKVPVVAQTGTNTGIPLRNKFYNVTTSGVNNISGGGANLGVSTRALELKNSSGTTTDVLMPAKSDNSTLQLSILDSSGSTHTIDMDVAE